jgi:hypothetical protein
VRGGSILPTTEPMSHVGEKPWDPLRFDLYPDDAGAARGSLYEDDGLTPDYQSGAFRRTSLTLAGKTLSLAAEGSFQPAARRFEVALHSGALVKQVLVDGQPLAAAAAAAAETGWFTDASGVVVVRIEDDGHARQLEFR